MTNKTNTFNQGAQRVITYGDVMSELNYISQTSYDDTARFEKKLKTFDNKIVCGFVVDGIGTKLKLQLLLSKLGIRFTAYHPGPTPVRGEIHIDPQYSQLAQNLFTGWTSDIIIEQRLTGNKNLDAKWLQPITKIR